MLIPSHMAWGFFFGLIVARAFRLTPVLPVLLIAGGLSDLDLITRQPVGSELGHHGVLHAPLMIVFAFLPLIIALGRTAVPYLVAAISHPLFGDYVANNIPLFSPFDMRTFGLNLFLGAPLFSGMLELLGFLLAVAFLFVNRRGIHATRRQLMFVTVAYVPLLVLNMREVVVNFSPDLFIASYALYATISGLTFLATILLAWKQMAKTNIRLKAMQD